MPPALPVRLSPLCEKSFPPHVVVAVAGSTGCRQSSRTIRRTAMTEDAAMRGEKIYECDLALTGVTDYGVSLDDILAGRKAVPPQGARFDLHVDGPCKGRLSGRQHGVDYVRMRADGRIDLDLHVIIETDDGQRIALSGDGQAAARNGEPVI